MTQADPWIDRLSEYVDDELSPRDRASFEAHRRDCAECERALDELRAVVSQAKSLGDRAPEDDLWPGIEARLDRPPLELPIGGTTGRRRVLFTFPQLAAAGLTLALLSAGGMWLAMHRTSNTPGGQTIVSHAPPLAARPAPETSGAVTPRVVRPEPEPVTSATVAGFDEERYADAVAELERVLHEHRADLDTSTVRILEQNLAIIDRATEQARRALLADPANPYLNGHLAEQMKKKIQLLQIATDYVAEHHS